MKNLSIKNQKLFKQAFGKSHIKFIDATMSAIAGRFVLDLFSFDDFIFEKHPEHTDKLSLKEVLIKEYSDDIMLLIETAMQIN